MTQSTLARPTRAEERSRRAPGGHTIIEMLLVLLLISALAGMAMPRLNYVSIRLDSNTRAVRGVLQQAWRMSIQKQHDVLVSIDTVLGRVRTLEDANNDGSPTTGERVTWRPLEEGARFDLPATGVNGAVYGAVTGPGVRGITGLPTIIFRRNGSTSGDVEIYLSADNHGVKEWRALTLAQATGRTEWFRRVNNVWRSGGN